MRMINFPRYNIGECLSLKTLQVLINDGVTVEVK